MDLKQRLLPGVLPRGTYAGRTIGCRECSRGEGLASPASCGRGSRPFLWPERHLACRRRPARSSGSSASLASRRRRARAPFLGNAFADDALHPVPRRDGTTDLYIRQGRFHDQFAADLPAAEAARMAATQRRLH
jgi:hypothetical protein